MYIQYIQTYIKGSNVPVSHLWKSHIYVIQTYIHTCSLCPKVIIQIYIHTYSLSVIEASIVVSRDSQKLIVIGKGGNKLKEVGTKARAKMEEVSINFFKIHTQD